MDWSLIVTLILNAISAILVLSLVALGLGIIFGLMGIINTAHGAFYTIGAYTVWFTTAELGLSFWLGLVIAPVLGAVIGYVTERLVVQYLYDRLLDSILAMWGVALILGELLRIAFGSTAKQVRNPLPGMVDLGITTYPLYRFFLMVLAGGILVSVFWFVYSTNYGIRLRAVIQNSDSASLLGVNQERMYKASFAFGTGLATLAGAAITPFKTIGPQMGITPLIQSFFAIILGGTGSLLGILPGSVVVGGLGNTMTFFIQPIVAQTIIFVIIIAAIVIKPNGILGTRA